MAEIRCPMCSKLNPPDADTCQFCQARLKPLFVSPFTNEGNSRETGKKDDSRKNQGDSALPDWLNELKPEDDTEYPSDDENELPDWLSESGATKDEQDTPGGSEQTDDSSGLPDWLARIRKRTDEDQVEEPKALEESDDEEGEGFEDWLSEIGRPEDVEKVFNISNEETSLLETDSNENEPEWLDRIRSRKQGDEDKYESTPSSDEIVEADLPDWISEVLTPKAEESSAIEDQPGKGSSDWLPEQQTPGLSPENNAEEVPDWLSSFPSKGEAEIEPDETTIPDWLVSVPGEEAEEPAEEMVPDWLKEVGTSQVVEEGQPETLLDEQSIEESEVAPDAPDWLSDIGRTSGRQPPAIEDVDITQEDESILATPDLGAAPDWLDEVKSDDAGDKAPGEEAGSEAGIERAELPSWLEAMRPVESVAPSTPIEETSARVEKAGPLAGLRGILPAEAEIARHRKPPTYSMKLQVTENQQAHIALLEGLLANEDEAKAVPKPQSLASQALLRIAVALVMMAAIIGALWMDGSYLPAPSQNIPVEVFDAQRLILGIQANAPVLVAFDFEAGLAGEMEAAAAPVLEQLAKTNAVITTVSTSTSGPLLAERWRSGYGDDGYSRFFNLGYIPAGQAGLLAFAMDPRAVMPYDLNSVNVWGAGPLEGVTSVRNFSMVLVLTDSPENGRAWIEQVHPLLREQNVPLLMVTSAKAEPMIKPYATGPSRQVSGMVSGFTGAAAFESINSGAVSSAAAWDAFGTGTLAAVGLIFVGSLVSTILAGIAWMKKKPGEEVI